jgi:hypothetical protein
MEVPGTRHQITNPHFALEYNTFLVGQMRMSGDPGAMRMNCACIFSFYTSLLRCTFGAITCPRQGE